VATLRNTEPRLAAALERLAEDFDYAAIATALA